MSIEPVIIGPGDPAPRRGRFVIAVPGHLAPVQHFALPTRVSGAARLAVARQLLADRLGPAAEGLEIIPVGGNQWTSAVVCDAGLLRAWCTTEAAQSGRCLAVLPDMLTLPHAADTVVLEQRDARLLARHAGDDGFAAPLQLAAPLLERLIESGGIGQYHAVSALPAEIQQILDQHDLRQVTAPAQAASPAVDLRKAIQTSGTGHLWLWAAAAVVAICAFGLYAATLWLETRSLRAEAADVREATIALLREDLIPNGPILDIRQQVAQAVAAPSGGDQANAVSAIDLLSRATVTLFGTGVDVGSITFDAGDGALAIDVTAPTFADVDQLVGTFREAGLLAAASDMRNGSAGGVIARVALQDAEAAQ